MPRVGFIVATKDRPEDLTRLLSSLEQLTRLPDLVVIVDGGERTVERAASAHPTLKIRYLRCRPPSATRQRNLGVQALLASDIELIGFLDDDAVLPPDALANALIYLDGAASQIGGVGFRLINSPALFAAELKKSVWAEKLGLYSSRPGVILCSGFQTMIGEIDVPTDVQWLPLGASIWRRGIFRVFSFDEWFSGYSYLEDLDFSYRVGKSYRLIALPHARFYHNPAPSGRGSGYFFGKREVLNRLHFVKKYEEFSTWRCYLALLVRTAMNLYLAAKDLSFHVLSRFLGNIVGLTKSAIGAV